MSTPEELTNFPAEVTAAMDRARALLGHVYTWNADGWKVAIMKLKGGQAGEFFEQLKTTPGWNLYSPEVIVWGWKP